MAKTSSSADLLDRPPMADEIIRSLTRAYLKHAETPPEVTTARKAKSDLLDRLAADDWRDETRDERRLMTRYSGVIEAHDAHLLESFSDPRS